MDFSNADITKSGTRIKEERKLKNLTQSQLAELIGYTFTNRNEISNCENKKGFLSYDRYELLAEKWNLRIEYLLGIDDFRTVEDLENSLIYKSLNEYQAIIHYLETLGLTLIPKYYFLTNINTLIKIENSPEKYYNLRQCFSEKALDYIKKRINIDYHFPSVKDEIREYIELKSIPDNNIIPSNEQLFKISKDEFIENDYFGDFINHVSEFFPECTDLTGNIILMYEVKYDNKIVALKEMFSLQSFFSHIDNICKICINDLIIDNTIQNSNDTRLY